MNTTSYGSNLYPNLNHFQLGNDIKAPEMEDTVKPLIECQLH